MNYISLKRTENKVLELNFNNKEQTQKKSNITNNSPKFLIRKELEQTTYLNELNNVSIKSF